MGRFSVAVRLLAVGIVAGYGGAAVGAPGGGEGKSTSGSLTVRVYSPEGAAVERFEAWLQRTDTRSPDEKLRDGRGGKVRFSAEDLTRPAGPGGRLKGGETTTALELIVQAPGYAPAVTALPQPEGDVETSVTLSAGRPVELVLKAPPGVEIPAGMKPAVFPRDKIMLILRRISEYDSVTPRPKRVFACPLMEEEAPGHYTFRWDGPEENLSLLVDHPGFLRAFVKPVSRGEMESGRIECELPQAAGVSVRFAAKPGTAFPETTTTLQIRGLLKLPGEEMLYMFYPYRSRGWGEGLSIEARDLAPGQYGVLAGTGDAHAYPVPAGVRNFGAQERVNLRPGETTGSVVLEFVPYEEAKYRGDYEADVKLTRIGGGSFEEETSWSLTLYDENYGGITVAEGRTPATGPLKLTGLPGGEHATTMTLEVGGETAGDIWLPGEQRSRQLEFRMPPMEGDRAPEIEMTDVLTSRPMRLSDYKGQVVFVDFWATWCGPCQEPMAHNQKIMAGKGEAWKGQAVILGCSIDEEMETVAAHVKKNGWTALPQGWASAGEGGWKSRAALDYGISSVPTAVLIGRDGKIVKRGHPDSFQIERDIEALLK